MWTRWVELETDCCLYLNGWGDSIAGTQGRPPSDMVIRPHYPTSGSFIWVYTSLLPRHTHFSHGLPWKSFTPEVQIKTERGTRESQGCGKSQAWRNSSGSIFICFLPWLCLHYSKEAFFIFIPNIKMPKNKYAASSTSMIDNFWSVIASIGPIAENILHFVLEEMVLSHMSGKSGRGEILVQPTGPERQRRRVQPGEVAEKTQSCQNGQESLPTGSCHLIPDTDWRNDSFYFCTFHLSTSLLWADLIDLGNL